MKTGITLSLLPNSARRPFVLGPDVRAGFRMAAELGFDGVEIFPPSLEALDGARLPELVKEFRVPVSTIGTGGGAVSQGLTLTDDDSEIRLQAKDYVRGVIERAADLNAAAIIGSMQGKTSQRSLAEVLLLLVDALHELSEEARQAGQPLFFEPLNRYESDLANTLADALEIVEQSGTDNLWMLADLFHMNIEEVSIADSLRKHHDRIGHIHFVDSNRMVAGQGHADLASAYSVLKDIGYKGYLTVEAFPLPNPQAAARNAMKYFRELGQKFS